jgi:hypothetical protein
VDGEDGAGGVPSDAVPLVESGAGSAGVSTALARGDHVHPALAGGGGGIPEPGTDGTIYGRGGATPAWVGVLPLNGGTVAGVTTFSAAGNALNVTNIVTAATHRVFRSSTITAAPDRGISSFISYSGTYTGAAQVLSSNSLVVSGDNVDGGAAGGLYSTYIGHQFGGSNVKGHRTGAFVSLQQTAKSGNLDKNKYFTAIGADASSNVNDNGTAGSFVGNMFGFNFLARLLSGATFWNSVVGGEIDVVAAAGVSVGYKEGFKVVLWDNDAAQGSVADYGIGLAASSAATLGFRIGLNFCSQDGYWPIDIANGTLIGAGTPFSAAIPKAAKLGVDFSSIAFLDAAFKSTGFQVDGTGNVTAVGGAFSSAVTAPTAAPGTTSTQVATTAFVGAAVAAGGGGGGIAEAPNDSVFYARRNLGWTAAVGSFNTRTGAVTLTSGDVTTALTFTPYNATNPSGYQTAANVTTTLAPYATTVSVTSAVAAGVGTAYTMAGYVGGVLTASQVLLVHQVGQAVTFPANFGTTTSGASSRCGSLANATASTVLTVGQCPAASDPTVGGNYTTIGTLTFSVGGHAGALATSGGTTKAIAAGDFIRITGPASADATLANVFLTLIANR